MTFPTTQVSAATDSRRLDEVLGEYAMSLVGKANDNMEAVEKYVGSQLIERFKDRNNELNKIVNGALSIEGGSTLPETWDQIVDFVFPVEKENVQLTSTPALKSAIADIIINMPDTIKGGNDYKYLGRFSIPEGATADSHLAIPFYYDYVKDVSSPYVYLRIEELTSVGIYTGLSYIKDGTPGTNDYTKLSGFGNATPENNVYHTYATIGAGIDEAQFTWLDIYTKRSSFRKEQFVADIYYSIGEPKATIINKSEVFSSSYLDKSSNDVYRILNGQYGDNTTVTYNFNQTYNNFNDYGLSPDQNVVDSGDGLLGSILDFFTSIPKVISDFLESLMGLVERIINIFIPTGEQIQGIGDSITDIGENFKGKFSAFIDLGDSLTSAFSKPSSIFDYHITLDGKSYPLIPSFLSASLGQVRTFLSGALVLFTFTNIYKRIVGSGDVIKS